MTVCNIKGVSHSVKPTENNNLTEVLQVKSSIFLLEFGGDQNRAVH